ncbi:DUF3000 domain-containing protein [Promicromonospora soli]|uniref:DUF3000 family protein n=1 Tax=Promicromonospora soli TaxID=2035533 RepID=A0A919FGI1_9MICO|nr:DUF3000 domain-containing protein [Promicromonospora soli]GHH65083.1 hypothetical protein GCM10017772_02660 [Promicromonospora soli]
MTSGPPTGVPVDFAAALADLRRQALRAEVRLTEIPAPRRVAPFSVALSGDVLPGAPQGRPDRGGDKDHDHSDEPLATGRFVVLHDPAGQEAWHGTFRVVTLVRATLEPEMAADPMLADVAWSWVHECLESAGLAPGTDTVADGGTVTRVLSQSYGALDGTPDAVDLEIRASWTPLDTLLGRHLSAWAALLTMAAGVPPLPEGVATLTRRFTDRSRQRHTVGP